MREILAAIYARFSSENQRPESIRDQVSMCRKVATDRGFVVSDHHIYTDAAVSGATWTRPGLDRLCEAARARLFDVVIFDDLSRLARDSYLMTRLMLDFEFQDIRVISVADGVDTEDPNSKLLVQLRGIFNEQFLKDLKEKTMRGLVGQKERGFALAEGAFGYRSFPVGALRYDKAGRARPEGHKMRIDHDEALVVLRIFKLYADGSSVSAIVRLLNREAVPGRYRSSKGWSPGSVTRILDQEKYKGRWIWNKKGKRRDPRSGKRRSYEKPESEWFVSDDESLRIVPQDLWERVRARREDVRGIWPGGKGRRGFSEKQGGRVRAFPEYLLSGAMVCGECGRSVVLVSGKGDGYYGCVAARNEGCDNRVKVPRLLAEKIIVDALQQRLADAPAIQYVFKRLQKEVAGLSSDVPETLRRMKAQLGNERRRRDNLVNFVAEGQGSDAIRERLAQTEQTVSSLEVQIQELTRCSRGFHVPSLRTIERRCANLRALLDSSVEQSALVLRELLGKIRLYPVVSSSGSRYCVAKTAFDTLKLLKDLDPDGGSDPGATSIGWWRRRESNPRPKIQHRRNLHAYPPLIVSLPASKGGGNRRKPSPDSSYPRVSVPRAWTSPLYDTWLPARRRGQDRRAT